MQPLFQAHQNNLNFLYRMSCQHQFLGMHAPGSLFPDWYHDILLIGIFEPALESDSVHTPYFYSRTKGNHFWDVLPEIFTGQQLKTEPHTWVPFLKQNRIGLTDLVLKVNDADPSYPPHAHLLLDTTAEGLEQFGQIDWNTEEIIKRIRQNNLNAVLITNTASTPAVERQIAKIKQAAIAEGIHFDRLVSPYPQIQLSRFHSVLPYPDLFATWFDAFSPIIRSRVI